MAVWEIEKKLVAEFFIFTMLLVCPMMIFPPYGAAEATGEDALATRAKRIETEREEKDRFFRESPNSPLRLKDQKTFRGLSYYPIDLRYVVSGNLERDPKGRKEYAKLPTNRGNFRTYIKEGVLRFKIEGREFVLIVYRFLGRSNLFLPFRDRTNGQETYENGRYLDVEILADEEFIVDFNTAHNPFCAYNPKYTCAYASEENVLDVAIPCGEKKFVAAP
ncbi:MAG: DUF1684 domain-containing protein [Proteobacteria bacterium]|nr:DUF1684 domain-containing protein [Pseudomonadota bacterium]NIS70024.1 DUF1684 domain-containing protein [Pseudomonadota bacterium]